MKRLTHKEIYANRKLVISYLRIGSLRKATGQLGTPAGARCCLGHMCDAFSMNFTISGNLVKYGNESLSLPENIMNKLGMFTNLGGARYNLDINIDRKRTKKKGNFYPHYGFDSLSDLNDNSKIRPHEIADYLEKVIMGGDETPWKALNPKYL